jgi:hypothetical protein
MSDVNDHRRALIATRLRQQALVDAIRITVHAHQEMAEEDISLEDVCEVLLDAQVVEDYPEHRRGACCLVCQRTRRGKYVHVVCTTSLDVAVIITVYEPRAPKWATPFERGESP